MDLNEIDSIPFMKKDITMIRKLFSPRIILEEINKTFQTYISETQRDFSYYLLILCHFARVRFEESDVINQLFGTIISTFEDDNRYPSSVKSPIS